MAAMRFPNILGQSAPTQLVEEAVPTLCNRLSHATLASDRRSAILGLKSFSRQYRETVAEYGLRPLTSALIKEHASADTVKPILETLLILFIRGESEHDDHTRGWISHQSRIQNGKYPSPLLMDDVSMDQFSLWIADELSQKTETMTTLIEILGEHDDFYIKLYSLQILESLVATRATKTKDIILSIPTAISNLVSLLKDNLEPVRNEVILLLMALVNNNFQIQKLVAFENTFDTLFDIIDEEGGIRGSIIVQDCLSLISNLLLYNASNQKYFLETLCVPRLAKLISEPVDEVMDDDLGGTLEFVWNDQRIQNTIIALDICSSFAAQDNELKASNQTLLFKAGVHFTILRLVFSVDSDNAVRSSALWVIADLIAGNTHIQGEFSRIDVPYIDPTSPSHVQTYANRPVYMCLLNWCLYINSVHFFDLRMAAAHCLHAYFKDNLEIKTAFISEQTSAFTHPNGPPNPEGAESANTTARPDDRTPHANIFSSLMEYSHNMTINPYRTWFAAAVVLYLFEDSEDLKEVVRMVKTGDESTGEEVMTAIPAISGLLLTSLEMADHRVAIGYLMLLTVWLFADFAAVNDFLSDASVTNSLLAYLANNATDLSSLLHGMITLLLGVAYEFSTKSSAIPRSELHSLLQKALGQDNYTLKVKQFKDSSIFKNFDEDSRISSTKDETGLPDVYFDAIYVTMIKENFSRVKKSLFHDPQREPHGHVTYEMFEEMDGKLASTQMDLEIAAKASLENEHRLNSQIEAYEKTRIELEEVVSKAREESTEASAKLAEVNVSYTSTKVELEKCQKERDEFQRLSSQYYKELKDLSKSSQETSGSANTMKSKLDAAETSKKKLEDGINNMTREMMQMSRDKNELQATIKKLQKTIDSTEAEKSETKRVYEAQLSNMRSDLERTRTNLAALTSKYESMYQKHATEKRDLEQKIYDAEGNSAHLMDKLRAAASAFQDLKRKAESGSAGPAAGTHSDAIAQKDKIIEELRSTASGVEQLEKNLETLTIENQRIKSELISLGNVSHDRAKNEEGDHKEVAPQSDRIAELQTKNELLVQELEKLQSSTQLSSEGAETMLANKQSQIEELEKRLAEVEAEWKELEKINILMKGDTELSETRVKELRDELNVKSQTIAELTSQLQARSTDNDELLGNEQELASKLKSAKSKIEALQLEMEALRAELSDLRAQEFHASTREEELASTNAELKERLDHYVLNIAKLTSDITDLKDELENSVTQRDLALEQALRIEVDFTGSQNKVMECQEEIDQFRKLCELLESKVLCLTENLKEKELGTKMLQDDVEELQSDNEKLQNELQQEAHTKADLESRLSETQSEIEKLKSPSNNISADDSRHLEQTLAHYEDSNENLRSLLEMLKEEVERCHKKIASLEKDGVVEHRPSSARQDEQTQLIESLEAQLAEALSQQNSTQESALKFEAQERKYKEETEQLRSQVEAITFLATL